MPLTHDARVAAYAWIEQDDRVLLAHWRGIPEAGVPAAWTLPGGGIEVGESIADCVLREVYEETGCRVAIDDLLGVDNYWRPAAARHDGGTLPWMSLRVLHTAHVVSGEPHVVEVDGTTDAVAWFTLAELDTLDTVGLVAAARRMIDRRP